ncbi:MAG: hypothetical protein KY468_17460 [Armatimonadetes bacterium]|nr:hypothetical protein [Armatimonadota bacterium]
MKNNKLWKYALPITIAFLTGGVGSAIVTQYGQWTSKRMDESMAIRLELRNEIRELKAENHSLKKENRGLIAENSKLWIKMADTQCRAQ